MSASQYIVWGPELSPFLLKLEALLKYQGLPFRRLPRDGSRLENVRTYSAIEIATRRRAALRYPRTTDLDEYPLVPYLITPDRTVLYDTTALAHWMDDFPNPTSPALIPSDPATRFVVNLIDEAFDELGLYLVHHNRWKLAASNNDDPGRRVAQEYRRLLPPGTPRLFGPWFNKRQVRRLPYLFSVAPAGYSEPGLAASITPPSRDGFPPTHELLEGIWFDCLAACETILTAQPYLLGNRFCLADASVYGQLSMNLTDTAAADALRQAAPRTFEWLVDIRDGKHAGTTGDIVIGPQLSPLLEVVGQTFVPLMQQNAAAYEAARQNGVTHFNEEAFNAGQALYVGTLRGHPFRSVAKSFQVRVWRELQSQWANLDSDAQKNVIDIEGSGTDLEQILNFAPNRAQ